MDITNTTALVTGANRGIGRAIVKALLDAGAARVHAAARDVTSLAATVALDPGRVQPLALDVTDAAQVAALPAKAPDVRLMINNAGVLDFGSALEAPLAAVERNMAVNFYGTLNVSRAVAPVIAGHGGGAIVNLITLVALASMPGLAVYNASKAAVWSITQSLRASLAAERIAVHGVFPGAVDTEMLAGVEMAKTSADDVAAAIIAGIAADEEDIFPDPMSRALYADWRADHKAVERQFAAM